MNPSNSSVSNSPTSQSSYWSKVLNDPRMSAPSPGQHPLDGQGNPIKGAHFVRRFMCPLSEIDTRNPDKYQPRTEQGLSSSYVDVLVESFERRKFDPTETNAGIILERKPSHEIRTSGKKYIPRSGWHRARAHARLVEKNPAKWSEWQFIIADEYRYDTPLAALIHAGATNCHFVAKNPATESDIRIQVTKAIQESMLDPNDHDRIHDFVGSVAGHLTKTRRDKIVKRALSYLPAGQIRPLVPDLPKAKWVTNPDDEFQEHLLSVQFWAMSLDLPVKQIQTNTYGDLQTYFSDEGSIEKPIGAGMRLWAAAGYPADQKIFIVQYVNTDDIHRMHNSSDALKTKRYQIDAKVQAQMKAFHRERAKMFNSMNELVYGENAKRFKGEDDPALMDLIEKSSPIVFAGFLPQDGTPDSTKEGLPKETTLVDKDGNPYNYKKVIGRK